MAVMPAPLVASVVPSKVRPEPTTSDLTGESPFPTRIPPSAVVEAVPPYMTPMEVVALTTPLLAWSGPFRVPMVSPPLRVLSALYVLMVVVLKAVVKTPVVELYASGYVAESEVEEILLLKLWKSVAERYPLVAVVA